MAKLGFCHMLCCAQVYSGSTVAGLVTSHFKRFLF